MVLNSDDGTQILEQILPYFTPEFQVTMNEMKTLGIKRDIPIVMNSLSTEDTYEGDFITRRALIHTLGFTVQGYFYGPTEDQGIIREVNANIGANFLPLSPHTITDTSIINSMMSSKKPLIDNLSEGVTAFWPLPKANLAVNDSTIITNEASKAVATCTFEWVTPGINCVQLKCIIYTFSSNNLKEIKYTMAVTKIELKPIDNETKS